jgi:hypothetical protein
MWKEIGC